MSSDRDDPFAVVEQAARRQAADLREKVLLYEDLLNVGLAGLHHTIDRADQAAATAALLLAAHGFAEPQPVGAG